MSDQEKPGDQANGSYAAMSELLKELVVAPIDQAIARATKDLATDARVTKTKTALDDLDQFVRKLGQVVREELEGPEGHLHTQIAGVERFLAVERGDLDQRLNAVRDATIASVAEEHATALQETEASVGREIRAAVVDIHVGTEAQARQSQEHVSKSVGSLGTELGSAITGARDDLLAGGARHADATVHRIEASLQETAGALREQLRDLRGALDRVGSDAQELHRRELEAANERHGSTRGSVVAAVGGAKQAVLDELGRAVATVSEVVPRETAGALSGELGELRDTMARLEGALSTMTEFSEQQRAWNERTRGEISALTSGVGGHERRLTEVAGALRFRLNVTLGALVLLVGGGSAMLWLLLR